MVEKEKNKPTFAEAAKGNLFGREAKDSQDSFELRLKTPGKPLQIGEIITAIKAKTSVPKNFFGLRREHQDLVASFYTRTERDLLLGLKSIKVKGVDISLSQFPPVHSPLSSGFRSVLLLVPMTATGSAIAKAIAPLNPLHFIIEKYRGTQVRTGRVILWTPSAPEVDHVFVNGTKTMMKSMERTKKDDPAAMNPSASTSAPEEMKKAAPPPKKEDMALRVPTSSFTFSMEGLNFTADAKEKKGKDKGKGKGPLLKTALPSMETDTSEGSFELSDAEVEGSVTPPEKSPPPPATTPPRNQNPLSKGSTTKKRKLSEISPVASRSREASKAKNTTEQSASRMDVGTFAKIGLCPTGHGILSIYENLDHEEEAMKVAEQVPSRIENPSRSRVIMANGNGTWDLYVLSTTTGTTNGTLARIYNDYAEECTNQLYVQKGWVQMLEVDGNKVLVLFKTRILNSRNAPS